MTIVEQLKGRARSWGLPLPFCCRHIEYSASACLDDEPGRANFRPLDISLATIEPACKVNLL